MVKLISTFQKARCSQDKAAAFTFFPFFIKNIKLLKEMFLGEALHIPECHMDTSCGENIVKTRFPTIATFKSAASVIPCSTECPPETLNKDSHLGWPSPSNPHKGRLGQGPSRGPDDSYPESDKIVENESDLAELEWLSLPHMVEVGLQDPFKHVGKWSI